MQNKTKKSKLWLLSIPAIAAMLSPVALAAGCKVVPAYEKGQYVRQVNSELTETARYFDGSNSYGSYQTGLGHHLTNGQLMRWQGTNQPVLKTVRTVQNVSGKTETKFETIIETPTFYRRRLEYVKEVVLTLKDGTVKVYDNDEAEVKPDPTEEIADANGKKYKHYKNISIRLSSNNAKSINSAQFVNDLKETVKLQLTIKPGAHYVDYKGEETKYEVVAKDFYYSWLRTVLLNKGLRCDEDHINGGTDDLDRITHAMLEREGQRAWTGREYYSNEYLYGLFGIDSSKFYKEDTFITKVDATANLGDVSALTFEAITGETPTFAPFFDKNLIDNYDFGAVSSQYLDEMNAANTPEVLDYLGRAPETKKVKLVDPTDPTKAIEKVVTAEAFVKMLNEIDKDSIVSKTGYYWYGASRKGLLFSGSYYLTPYDKQDPHRIVYKVNKGYWDKEFVNDPNVVKEYIVQYQQKKVSKEDWQRRSFIQFKQGTSSSIPYSELSEKQKQTVSSNPAKYGLRYTKPLNRSVLKKVYTTSHIPAALERGLGESEDAYKARAERHYLFSDAYSLMNYGVTKLELAKGEVDYDARNSKLGLSYRTILNAAINWNAFMNVASSNTQNAWIASVAPDSSMGGKDTNPVSPETPRDYYDYVNSLRAIDVDGNLIDFGGTIGKEVSPSENYEGTKDKVGIDKIKSAVFAKLQEEMGKVLAAFDAQYPQYAGKQIAYTEYYPYVGYSDTNNTNAINKVHELYRELSGNRINYEFKFAANADEPEFARVREQGATGLEHTGWSYDYDSPASGFDAFSWLVGLTTTLSYIDAKKPASIVNNFPELTNLAKAFVEYATQQEAAGKLVTSVPYKDLYLISNKDSRQLKYANTGLNYMEFIKINGKYELAFGQNGRPKRVPGATDPFGFSAKFFQQYFTTLTNEQIKKLIAEYSSFNKVDYGFAPNISDPKETFSPYLLLPAYQEPVVTNSITNITDTRIVVNK